ncbi:MAG: hypothetical protein V8Q77_04235 [Bacilli bacterium]
MKRIIVLFIMFTLSVAIVGCNNDTKTYMSEELAQNLQLIKNNKNDSEGETKFIDDNDKLINKNKRNEYNGISKICVYLQIYKFQKVYFCFI